MDDLIAFLNARLDEREAALQRLATAKHNESLSRLEIGVHTEMSVLADVETWPRSMPPYEGDAWRMLLADIASKRQIIVEYVEAKQAYEGIAAIESWPDEARGRVERASYHQAMNALAHAVRLLALPFASHPDYRESWRP